MPTLNTFVIKVGSGVASRVHPPTIEEPVNTTPAGKRFCYFTLITKRKEQVESKVAELVGTSEAFARQNSHL